MILENIAKEIEVILTETKGDVHGNLVKYLEQFQEKSYNLGHAHGYAEGLERGYSKGQLNVKSRQIDPNIEDLADDNTPSLAEFQERLDKFNDSLYEETHEQIVVDGDRPSIIDKTFGSVELDNDKTPLQIQYEMRGKEWTEEAAKGEQEFIDKMTKDND